MVTANCVRKTLRLPSPSTKTLFSRQSSPLSPSYAAKFKGLPSSKVSTQNRSFSLFRLPVQLSGVQVSLTQLHNATASALFTSLLSLHNNNWGCLSEETVKVHSTLVDIYKEFKLFELSERKVSSLLYP